MLIRRASVFVSAALFVSLAYPQIMLRDLPMSGRDAGALNDLVSEALKNNPEIKAAFNEKEAALQRVSPAGALEDPMIEAGLLNVPATSWRLNREDMTMKMLGLSQKLPFPGKLALRREVAEKDAAAVAQGYRETLNRVVREVKLAYFDLGLAIELTCRHTEQGSFFALSCAPWSLPAETSPMNSFCVSAIRCAAAPISPAVRWRDRYADG